MTIGTSKKVFLLVLATLTLVVSMAYAQTTSTELPNNSTTTGKPGECTQEGVFAGMNPGEYYMCKYDKNQSKLTKYQGQCKAEYVKTVYDDKRKRCVLPSDLNSTRLFPDDEEMRMSRFGQMEIPAGEM